MGGGAISGELEYNDLVLPPRPNHRLTVVTNRAADAGQDVPKVVAEVEATEALLTATTSGLGERTAQEAHATDRSEQRPVHLPASTPHGRAFSFGPARLLGLYFIIAGLTYLRQCRRRGRPRTVGGR